MTPSILIIEDDLTFATMLKTWLGKKGFEVDTAGSKFTCQETTLSTFLRPHIV